MKLIKNYIWSLLSLVVLATTSCENDDPVSYDNLTVSTANESVSVDYGATGTAIFNVSFDSNLTATYEATGTGVNISNPTGTVNGKTVTINFTTGTNAGAASITLKVSDSQKQSSSATALINIGQEVTEVTVNSNITSNTTWKTGKTYILAGRITVVSGVTLTIEPGVVVKGQAGTGANATALMVARGAKLMAEGTASLPIIFTSVADEITPAQIAKGDFTSPNLAPDVNGLWGGLLILGKAPISASNSSGEISEVQIEGIPTSDTNGLYGGNEPNDNSGVLKYISIRHGGANIGSGNEINGLTLGGVGSGTVIENIEVVANQDDGIEWFGGTVNVSNAVVWNAGDDAIDTDQAWSGILSNFVVLTPGNHCFELDGPEGAATGGHSIEKGYIISTGAGDLINTDANSDVDLKELYFTGIDVAQMINRVNAPLVTFASIVLNVNEADLASHVNGTVPAGITAGTKTFTDFTKLSWTWASKAGKF